MGEERIIVGVTATRYGLRAIQLTALSMLFKGPLPLAVLHHGMCEGGDTEIHDLVRDEFPHVIIEGHPPKDKKHYVYRPVDRLWPEKEYHERNADIIKEAEVIVACPRYNHAVLRSGTWSVIRRASLAGKKVLIVWPSGRIERAVIDPKNRGKA
jgi:hypothetical protein